MAATVKIKPEVLTPHGMRMELRDPEVEHIGTTVGREEWAWVLARKSWVYAGEPDFIHRQIREVVVGLPDIAFDEAGIEESVRTILEKARSDEERAEARTLLRQAFEKTGQLDEAERFLSG